MDCWIVIGGKLQNFAARSYCFAAAVPVFHACMAHHETPGSAARLN
jgi:hypothetical protein